MSKTKKYSIKKCNITNFSKKKKLKLWLYQVGNTSSCKNTAVKQLGPWLALELRTWMGDH